MKTFNQIICFVLLSTMLANCGGSEKQVSEYNDPQVESLIESATDMDYLIASEQILRNASQRDLENLKSSLHNIRVNLAILDETPQNSEALSRLSTAILAYESLIITERDQERIRPVFDAAAKLLAKYARTQKTDLNNIRWSVFSYRFSDGLGDFTNMVPNAEWKVRFVQQERYLATYGNGKPTMAVMLSPIYDLTRVKNLAYSMRHNIGVEDDLGSETTRSEVMNNTFKVMVSTTYKKGDAFDISEFKRLPMGPTPSGLNFDTIDTGIINLKAYEGKSKVTFAIIFDHKTTLERYSWLSWSIERFNLFGLTDTDLPYVSAFVPPAPTSWEYNLGEQGFKDGLQQVTVEGTPEDYEVSEHNNVKFMKMQNQNARGTKLLFTTPLDIKDLLEPAVQLKQTINFYEGEAKTKKDVRMVIAEYKKGVAPQDLEWQTLDFKTAPAGDGWDIVNSEELPIPEELKGKVIRLGWSHTSRDGSTPVWQIISTNIKDLAKTGADVTVLEDDFVATPQAPPVDPAAISWSYDLGEQGLAGLTQVTTEGAPGEFTEGEHNEVKFVKMQARDVIGTQLLYTDVIDLTNNTAPSVQLTHTINFYNEEFKATNDVKVMVALEQDGVAPKDLAWESIDFKNGPGGKDWKVYTTEDFILPEAFKAQKIRISWSHTARADSTPVWQILSVNIKDQTKIGE